MLDWRTPVAVATVGALVALTPANAQDSENVTLLGNFSFSSWHSDVWGYESGGVALAIVGGFDGTSFIDVTDPTDPTEVAFIPGSDSIWRQAATYGTYAYLVNDDYGFSGQGLQVVDLSNPLAPVLVNEITADFDTAHNVFCDTATGLVYACGFGDDTLIYDAAADPINPPLVYTMSSFYVHDLFVADGIAYMAAINNGQLRTMDASALPGSLPLLDSVASDNNFTHNVWVTDDRSYALTTDEVSTGHITVVDCADPSNLTAVASYTNDRDPSSIIHNVLIDGDLAYVAWYRAGFEVLDISVPTAPVRVGYYDTFPGSGDGYDGAWGVYPFASSGYVYVTDIDTGLYIFEFDPNGGFLEGTITDADTSDPIDGVEVSIDSLGRSTLTDASGYYRFALSADAYTVDYAIFGYAPESRSVTVAEGSTTIEDLTMTRLPSGSLAGIVETSTTFAAIPGASVEVLGTPLATTTDAGGNYSFASIPAGSYSVVADAVGYAPVSAVVVINADEAANENFALDTAPIFDDFEADTGWIVGAAGDDASTGIWELVDPRGSGGGAVQPEDDHTPSPGTDCFVTGQTPFGGGIGDNDVDDGSTTLTSPVFDLGTLESPTLVYHRWYVNDAGSSQDDEFVAQVSENNGASWVTIENLAEARGFWEKMTFDLDTFVPGATELTVRFIATDDFPGSIVEAGIDDLEVYGTAGTVAVPGAGGQMTLAHLAPSVNPFRTDTMLKFSLNERALVSLSIYDIGGRRITSLVGGVKEVGTHAIAWDGTDRRGAGVPPGVYMARLQAGSAVATIKLVRSR